ncbi:MULTISPECIES: helix-turn-helix domain-containing protein [Metabacillus]|uniref:helix-turn-helix domain-containing protein n=1 Tax=Metabacillus TaxID=2675233 RepID=UPI001157774B|nr:MULTISPECIES: helix-turn-helix domain-containing protein [Metabacillus]MCM3443582.1 helix-turn-helix transcriptional regulator [Metabacillus halosaccharovorans]
MENIPIGDLIRELRKQIGFTQKQLAKDICTQALISKIENNTEIPSSLILFKLANKLNVDMNYFFEQNDKDYYTSDLIKIIRKHIRNREYIEVYEIVQKEMSSPLYTYDIRIKQFLLWHKGITLFYINGDFHKSVEVLMAAINITGSIDKQMTEREIEILNSIGILYNECNLYKQSIEYYNLALVNKSNMPNLKDFRIHIRVLYGLSKSYKSLKEYDKSIEIAKKV